MNIEIRAMTRDDVDAAGIAWRSSWQAIEELPGADAHEPITAAEIEIMAAGHRYFLDHDPKGCFVALRNGDVVGLATSCIRGDTYVLSNFGVAYGEQGNGIGRLLLERVLDYGTFCPKGRIYSSPDPRAFARYVGARFHLWPAMRARVNPSSAHRVEPLLRRVEFSDHLSSTLDEIDADIRGATRTADLAHLFAAGAQLWLCDDGAYALTREDRILTFVATTPALGQRALAGLLSPDHPGPGLAVSWITSERQWAFAAAVDAGATLEARGAVMVRGEAGPAGAYLPSGLFA